MYYRRPLSTREKCIHSMTVQKVDDYHFSLGLKTQAGTYPFSYFGVSLALTLTVLKIRKSFGVIMPHHKKVGGIMLYPQTF